MYQGKFCPSLGSINTNKYLSAVPGPQNMMACATKVRDWFLEWFCLKHHLKQLLAMIQEVAQARLQCQKGNSHEATLFWWARQ